MNVPVKQSPHEIMESVLIKGDLSKLTAEERNTYYRAVCTSVGLNPLTKPLEYINLNGKLRLYALKDCTDQLRSIHKVSVTEMTESERDGVYIVKCKVQNDEGRTDMAIGAVNIANLKGENLANAMMKTETKSKRRATLSICGLGMLDETEVEDIPRVQASQARVPSPTEVKEVEAPAEKPAAAPKHQKPHAIDTKKNSTFDKWMVAYIAGLEGAASVVELNEWDKLNDNALEMINEKSPKIYEAITAKFNEVKNRLQRDSISSGVPSPPAETPRPEGCPNAELEPEAFVVWGMKMMDDLDNPDDLSNVWETVITPASDGLFKPDVDSLKEHYEKRLAKLV